MSGGDPFKQTPSQTAGPYLHIGCVPNCCGIAGVFPEDLGTAIAGDGVQGTRITVSGIIYDGTGTPLRDALVEIWQADAQGRYSGQGADPGFAGWGRAVGDPETGLWSFETIKPGPVSCGDRLAMAPHITVWIAARGLNAGLFTRMYFPDEADANEADPVLAQIEHRLRIPTLIAEKTGDGAYRFNIHLQGDKETVFFDV